MSECTECARLHRLMAPKVDLLMLAQFKKREPTKLYFNPDNWGMNDGQVSAIIKPSVIWGAVYETTPSDRDTAAISQVLQALGWRRTRRTGYTYYCMPVKELNSQFGRG